MAKLLVKDLKISLLDKKLVDIDFFFEDSLAIIGQSGSGKSLTLKAIMSLLPSNISSVFNYETSFDISFDTVSFIPQNPFTALSPMTLIKEQFFVKDCRKVELLSLVGLDETFLDKYPPQLSGGQLQRVVIAMALEKEPKLLLLDEPTTALDFDTKKSILELILKLQKQLDCLIIFVTHDIDTIKDICKYSLILKNGKVVEFGITESILKTPSSEYAKKLISSNFQHREFRT
jgi:peptide/nickel transport system ATP-binding protein